MQHAAAVTLSDDDESGRVAEPTEATSGPAAAAAAIDPEHSAQALHTPPPSAALGAEPAAAGAQDDPDPEDRPAKRPRRAGCKPEGEANGGVTAAEAAGGWLCSAGFVRRSGRASAVAARSLARPLPAAGKHEASP